jgi:hypothetical protein
MVHRKIPLVLATLAAATVAFAAPRPAGDDERRAPPRKLLVRAGRIYTGAAEGAASGTAASPGKVASVLSPGALLLVDGKVASATRS